MARPDTQAGVDDGNEAEVPGTGTDATGVVRPGTGVVRPGTGVVRPSAGGGVAAEVTAAKARAVVPDAPETPLEPIHVVLPIIEVMPAKQGFLDRLVAPKPKKEKKKGKAKEESADEYDGSDDEDYDDGEYDESYDQGGFEPTAYEAAVQAPPALPPPPVLPPPSVLPPPPVVGPVVPPAAPTAPATAPVRVQPVAPPPPPLAPPRVEPAPRPAPAPPPVRPAPTRPSPPPRTRERMPRRSRRQPVPEYDGYGDDWPAEAPTRRPVRWGRWVAAAVVLALVALGGGLLAGRNLRPAVGTTWLTGPGGGKTTPVLAALSSDAPEPSPAGIAAQIQSLLNDARLAHSTASVVDVATGTSLYERDGASPVTPASTQKVITGAVALAARGPGYRIPTRAVAGSAPGEIVLVGGGDPTLAGGPVMAYPGAARLDVLAREAAKALGGAAPTHVIVDSSLFQGPSFAPSWNAQDAKDGFISNITALMTDGARSNPRRNGEQAPRYQQPDLAAGQIFAKALGLPASAVSEGTAPADARQLAEVLSPPLSRIVEMMLDISDNVIAEALARQVALAKDMPASFEGGADATRQVLSGLGISMDGLGLVDGSGLSYGNKVSVQLLTSVLAKAAGPDGGPMRAVLSGLPVAGWSGTLSTRFLRAGSGGSAAGTVRAKTGTLSGVNGLAGLVVDADGRLLAFALVANNTTQSNAAEAALDRVAAALAGCGCS